MLIQTTAVLLFAVAMAVALIARAAKIPYTVALVVVGLLLGATHAVPAPVLTKDLLYAVFLPGLLFEAALNLDARAFWKNKLAIAALAVPGVVVSMLATAWILVTVRNGAVPWGPALAFAAAVSATDPVAIVARLKSMHAPERMRATLEAESLLNDGTASVLYLVVVGWVGGAHETAFGVLLDIARLAIGGIAIGLAVGFVLSNVIARVDEPVIELSLTVIAAYGSFVVAEQLRTSGILATTAAGMLCGSYGVRGMSERTRTAVDGFWDYLAFALNSVIFLLIGFTVSARELLEQWWPILLGYVATIAARALVVALVALGLARTRERIPFRWGVVLAWGGMRGALSMVLALALPQGFPHRDMIVTVTFGVVLLSIVVNGLTVGPIVTRIRVDDAEAAAT